MGTSAMPGQLIKTLFANEIGRRIEEVIKIDQTDAAILGEEIDEYVVTKSIRSHYTRIFDEYRETPNKPHEGIAIWVSGFFGSGKSSFAKMLGLSIENRSLGKQSVAERFAIRAGDKKLEVLLKTISEKIPTHTVIFDVSTDRGIRSGNQTLTEIMYGLFLQSLGYAKDLDLSELEIGLEEKGKLDAFEKEYARQFPDRQWKTEKGKVAFALSEASRVLHNLEPKTFPMADSWVKAVKNKADITPGKLAERATELMARRRPGQSLLFVVDEVGQFVARDVQKMLDLQAVVQRLGVVGRGRHWIVVTSQEKLDELVSGLDDTRIELARLMDRFPLQVHLEPSDISEVTSRRVLSKDAKAQNALGKLYDQHRARLLEHTRMTADIKLPELTRDAFVDLYPLLPYQIDLIIQAVSGLRTQSGASKHVGGANRTIIKLAQQLLINPAVALGEQPLGSLARLDQVYDLIEGNIASDLRAKIAAIPKKLAHPLAQAVAKTICVLQFVKTVHRTAENIAAALHPAIEADSQLAAVKEALRELEATHDVRRGEDGYRIPSPAEDDWERTRNGTTLKPGEEHRLHAEILTALWQPQPSHTLFETKTFKAGLAIHGRDVVDGDMTFHVHFAEEDERKQIASELRTRSQNERKSVFWVVGLNDAVNRETQELFRSKEILSRKERDARTDDTGSLVSEEKVRQRRHQDELRRLLKMACLSGGVYFRGNDRSPGERSADVAKSAAEILGQVLPVVFERFKEAAARPSDVKKGVEALLVAENLQGLPPVFSSLSLLRDEKGKTVFRLEGGALAEALGRIEERANYGDTASGRFLADELAKEPFGWDFDVVRLLVLSLLRAGKIEATSKGQTIDSATSVEAREVFSNNNVFRQASFRPKKGIEFEEIVKAGEAFRDTFGMDVRELNASAIQVDLRRETTKHEDGVAAAHAVLVAGGMPGVSILVAALDQMKAILRGSEDKAIAAFNASHRSIKDAIRRASEIEQALTGPRTLDLERAKRVLAGAWPFLQQESDLPEELRTRARALEELLARETFFRDLPAIDQHARALETEHARRYEEALKARVEAYTAGYQRLVSTPGWAELGDESKKSIGAPLQRGMVRGTEAVPVPQLRSERDACDSRTGAAIREVLQAEAGARLVAVNLSTYFAGGIDNVEQLDSALAGIREECAKLLGAGKKIVLS